MGSFGVNFNFDFGNLKLDKLFDDANKSGKANLSSNQIDVSSNYNANSANNYSGNNKNSVETMDFSSKVNNKNQSNSINISNNNSINNTSNETNSNIDSSKVNINTQNNNNQNFSTLNQNSPNQNTKDSNVNVNSKSTSDMKNNISNSNVSTNSMDNSNSTNNQNISVDTNSSKVDITSNNSKNDIDISKNSSTINNTSTNSSSGSNSATMNNSSNISTGNNNSSIDVSINMDNQETSEDSDNMTVKDGKVIIVTTDQSGNQVNVEIDVEDYKSNLKVYGFTEEDINRIISGEISPEKLLEEIQSDSDNTRRKKMMESSYLQAYGLNFNDMSELKNACAEKTKELEKLLAQRANVDNNRELDSIMNIVTRLKMGESLDNILKSEIVAWKYTDENGNTCYRYDDPYINGNYDGITYESLYFSDMYQDSEILKKLQNVLSVETIDPLFGDKYQVQRWTESDEQQKFFDDLAKKYSESIEKRQSEVKKLDEKITELQQQKETYEYVYNYIDKEVNYYLTNIDAYTSREDFYLNNSFNSKCLDKVNELNKKYNGIQMYDYSSGISNVYINEKAEIVDIISCMINGKGNISNGYLSIGTSIVQLSSRDDMLAHYEKWLPFVTENEIQVFNYIYNTQGTDKAYEYLENISDELDNRWLANKTQEDQEFASEHPILASIGSIVVTPIEGISAVCYSMNSYFTGEKIRRADVYSAGDVWRGQVSQDIAENYGEGWAFVYSTGMSMTDSVSLIALSAATGGVATPVLSATLMGSRAYVSTLNDALDRGLSDGSAILLASTSAIVETAMESYSVGHLLNLESKLGKTTLELTSKIANNIGNETVANLVTKSFYISASALSQGLAEGEEEFATEILNYVADIFISKDLSNYSQSINQYLELGYSEDQALFSTMKDFSKQAFQAFLGGFVSGVCFGTFGGSTSTINTSYGISQKMYNDLYGNKAQQFAQALEINQQQIQEYSDALKDMKNGKTLNDEQISLLNNGPIEMQSKAQLKNNATQNIKDLGNKIKSIIKTDTLVENHSMVNTEVVILSDKMMKIFDTVMSNGTIENLISKAKGENGKIAGTELFKMLGYDLKPTIVEEEKFQILANSSKYGVLVRGISGENAEQHVNQFINGDMYVGGTHASIKGTGIYTGFGISAQQIGEKYATRAGTENGGSVIEMLLNQDAMVIEYNNIVEEQNQVLDVLAMNFSKYSNSIVDFDTLLSNLDKITIESDLIKAKFITNFLSDTGYYAALRGYDAIVDSFDNYLTVLNRGKLTVKENINEKSVTNPLNVQDSQKEISMTSQDIINKYNLPPVVLSFFDSLGLELSEVVENNSEHYTIPRIFGESYNREIIECISNINVGSYNKTQFDIFDLCYNPNNVEYQWRSSELLTTSAEDIIDKINNGADKIICCRTADGNLVVSENGRHRISVLQMLYQAEIKKATTQEEINSINQKYQIKVFETVPDELAVNLKNKISETKYKEFPNVRRADNNDIILESNKYKVADEYGGFYYKTTTIKITEEQAQKLIDNSEYVLTKTITVPTIDGTEQEITILQPTFEEEEKITSLLSSIKQKHINRLKKYYDKTVSEFAALGEALPSELVTFEKFLESRHGWIIDDLNKINEYVVNLSLPIEEEVKNDNKIVLNENLVIDSNGKMLDSVGNIIGSSFDSDIVSEIFKHINGRYDKEVRATSCMYLTGIDGKKYVLLKNQTKFDIEKYNAKANEILNVVNKGVNTPKILGFFEYDGYSYQIQEMADGQGLFESEINANRYDDLVSNLEQLDILNGMSQEKFEKILKDLSIILDSNLSIDSHPGNLILDPVSHEVSYIDLSYDTNDTSQLKNMYWNSIYNQFLTSIQGDYNYFDKRRNFGGNVVDNIISKNDINIKIIELKNKFINAYVSVIGNNENIDIEEYKKKFKDISFEDENAFKKNVDSNLKNFKTRIGFLIDDMIETIPLMKNDNLNDEAIYQELKLMIEDNSEIFPGFLIGIDDFNIELENNFVEFKNEAVERLNKTYVEQLKTNYSNEINSILDNSKSYNHETGVDEVKIDGSITETIDHYGRLVQATDFKSVHSLEFRGN